MKIITASKEELDTKGAEIISQAIESIPKKHLALAVPGGRSVPGIFKKLKEMPIPWDRVHIFMVDERLVPINHKDSNFKLAKESFIDNLVNSGKLPISNVHPFELNEQENDLGLKEYADELKSFGGEYDIVLLSSGEDGHIGALYPDHKSIEDESDYFIKMHDSPKPPKDRMTMSKTLLLKSKVVLLLFVGEGKREAFNKFNDQSIDYKSCPAKLVEQIRDSFVLTDLK